MATSEFILQGFMPRTHASAVQRLLELKTIEHGILSVAFVNNSGVDILSKYIAPVAKQITVYAGIRNDITSLQGLEALLKLGVKLHVVDTGSRRLIFHPKIYAARSKDAAHLVVGSANFTAGGLNNNIEGGILLDLDMKHESDAKLYNSIETEFAGLHARYPDHIIEIKSSDQLKKMEEQGRLLDETKVEPPRPVAVSKGKGAEDNLKRISLNVRAIFRAVKKVPAPKAPTPAPAVEEGVAIGPSTSVGWTYMWESTDLTRRDLTIPEEGRNTNQSGSINLDKGRMAAEVDHRHYFRDDVFQELEWTESTKTVDEAHAKFQLVIKGVDYGEFDLRIGHTTSTDTESYRQRNAMTRLSWGPIRKHIAQEQYIGRTLSLYRDTNDPKHFLLELD